METTVDRLMPVAGRNRACPSSVIFNTFMLMLHEGARCLDDVRILKQEAALMRLMGLSRLPDAHTLGNWLRALGSNRAAMTALEEINRRLLAAGLHNCTRVTLDIDATVIEAHKKEARYSYKKVPGFTPMVGHDAGTGLVVSVQFRAGNVPPNKDNLEFIMQCGRALPAGVSVSHVRIDAAGYQAAIINHCESAGIRFAIRAKMDQSVKQSMDAIRVSDWKPLTYADGTVSESEQVAHCLHVMGDTAQAFVLVVQRRLIGEREADPQPDLFPGLPGDVDEETATCGRCMYRAIATNLDGDGLDDHQVVEFYNLRADRSENRIKELRSDFAAAHLPCSGFDADAAWFMLCSIAYNLLALMRMLLPPAWERCRAITVRHRLYVLAGQIVHHARQWTLKLNADHRAVPDQAVWSIRHCVLK